VIFKSLMSLPSGSCVIIYLMIMRNVLDKATSERDFVAFIHIFILTDLPSRIFLLNLQKNTEYE